MMNNLNNLHKKFHARLFFQSHIPVVPNVDSDTDKNHLLLYWRTDIVPSLWYRNEVQLLLVNRGLSKKKIPHNEYKT